jgi:RHS repeat-associated protein
VIDALNQRTEYGYDLAGNMTSIKDASNHVTTYRYDALNRRVDTVLPMGQLSRVGYDAVGNMASFTNANGEVITYEYDKLNRLTKKILPDETFVMTYAAIGKLAAVTDSRGTTTYSYDARQRLTEQKEPDGQFLRYGYDAANERTSITTASGTTNFTYDKYKELKSVIDADGAVTSYSYDKAGNLIETDLSNGVIEKRSYDLLNRLTLTESKKGVTVLFSAAYTLDNAGMRTKVVENNRTVNYTYDGLYRLLSESGGASSTSYTYSPTGNRLTKTSGAVTSTYVYDADDRLLSDGTSTFTYDNNGNKKTETKAGVTTTYTWDAENRLKATLGGGVSTVYDYDYSGIRVSQTVNGVETRFLVDKNRNYAQVLAEYAPSGTVQVAYVFGSDLISQDRNGTKSFYVYDGLGSTRALTDASGTVTDSYSYDAYGNLVSSSGSTVNSYLYAGEQFDKNLGDYYLRDRYYSTDIGRFTQRDRFDGDMNNPLSLNKYGYTHGNPVNGTDPSGMFLLGEFSLRNALESQIQAQQTTQTIRVLGYIGTGRNATIGTTTLARTLPIVATALFAAAILRSDEPDETGIPYIVWGLEYGVTNAHTYRALHGSGFTKTPGTISPSVLHYREPAKNDRNWIKPSGSNFSNIPYPCNRGKIGDGLDCDEYPYNSSQEGGQDNYNNNGNVSIALVPGQEQRFQGGNIKEFYRNALNYTPGAVFGVWAKNNSWNSYYVYYENGIRRQITLPPVPLYRNSNPSLTYNTFDNLLSQYNQ